MAIERAVLETGYILELGNNSYRIESVIGCGGSSIVYRATYKDELNRDSDHTVLIKELFPLHPKGEIFRAEDCSVICAPVAFDYFDFHKERFRLGNEVNLTLLKRFPSEISGNLNSYEAHGTYYSVLTAHGGENLESRMEAQGIKTLREAANITLMILRSLECFHDNGMLHLDISPDNVLLIGDRAMLIDFNSTWHMDKENSREFAYSEKEGFSPPEITLRSIDEIGYSSDLYSVCAVFYRMVSGEKLKGERASERQMRETLTEKLPIFRDEFRTAVYKTIQILTRGLHILPRKRFLSCAELCDEIEELIARIDGKGVSKSALWEISRISRMKTVGKDVGEYLDQNIRLGNDSISVNDLCARIYSGKSYLLYGVGGIGKTRFLRELWTMGTKNFHNNIPIAIYVPLKMYQESSDDKQFIRKYIAGSLTFSDRQNSVDDIIHELDVMFEKSNKGKINVMLLLDGLNEAGKNAEGLLREIETLSEMPGVGMILTDRTSDVKKYGLRRFETVKLDPLKESTVTEALARSQTDVPKDGKMLSLLSNPMMLELYIKTYKLNSEASGEKIRIENVHELINYYMDTFVTHQQRVYTGDEKLQIRNTFILRQLLPEIAYEMNRRSKSVLSLPEMMAVVKRNYLAMNKRSYGKVFPEYLGKSRLILEGISSDSEWFDSAVREMLCDETGLVVRYEGDRFSLIHDNFTEALAENAKPVIRYYNKQKIKSSLAIGAATAGACAIIAGAIYLGVRNTDEPEKVFTVEEHKACGDISDTVSLNISTLNSLYKTQNDILVYSAEYAETGNEDVLIYVDSGVKDLERSVKVRTLDDEDVALIAGDDPMLAKCLEFLNSSPNNMQENARILTGILLEYVHDSKRYPEMVQAYEAYLEAYNNVVYKMLLYVMECFPDDIRTDFIGKGVTYTDMFDGSEYDFSSNRDKEDLEKEIENAIRDLDRFINNDLIVKFKFERGTLK